MNSEETVVTLKLQVKYGYDEKVTDAESAFWDAIQLAINPDFSNTVKGTYLNGVRVFDENDEILTYV